MRRLLYLLPVLSILMSASASAQTEIEPDTAAPRTRDLRITFGPALAIGQATFAELYPTGIQSQVTLDMSSSTTFSGGFYLKGARYASSAERIDNGWSSYSVEGGDFTQIGAGFVLRYSMLNTGRVRFSGLLQFGGTNISVGEQVLSSSYGSSQVVESRTEITSELSAGFAFAYRTASSIELIAESQFQVFDQASAQVVPITFGIGWTL